jgi:hypothetical protein
LNINKLSYLSLFLLMLEEFAVIRSKRRFIVPSNSQLPEGHGVSCIKHHNKHWATHIQTDTRARKSYLLETMWPNTYTATANLKLFSTAAHEAVAWQQFTRDRHASLSRFTTRQADELLRLCRVLVLALALALALVLVPPPPAATPLRLLLNTDPGSSATSAEAAAATETSKGRGENELADTEPAGFDSTVTNFDAASCNSISAVAASDDNGKGDKTRLWLQSSRKLD